MEDSPEEVPWCARSGGPRHQGGRGRRCDRSCPKAIGADESLGNGHDFRGHAVRLFPYCENFGLEGLP
eukprot:10516000-Heterocapsa_arctica.AAC.1